MLALGFAILYLSLIVLIGFGLLTWVLVRYAELTRERFRELALQESDQVYVKPRQVRVFVEEDKSGGGKAA